MSPTGQKLLNALRGPKPPQTPDALAEAIGIAKPRMYVVVSQLIHAGLLTQKEVPWRVGGPENSGKPRGGVPSGFAQIARQANQLAKHAEKDSDKLTALKLLTDLKQMGGEMGGPPPPGDDEGTRLALNRVILSAGPKLTKLAIKSVYPSFILIDPAEAPIAEKTETPVLGPGPPAC
jgi:hypothetical protein